MAYRARLANFTLHSERLSPVSLSSLVVFTLAWGTRALR